MNIHRALADIADIRAQLDRTEALRGFRSAAVGISVVFLILGSLAQRWLDVGTQLESIQPIWYLGVWISVAIASALVAAAEMIFRGLRSRDPGVWNLHRQLAIQITPCLIAGALITAAIAANAMESPRRGMVWALPGIWSLIYGTGLFSCLHRLPRYSRWVAIHFLVAGAAVLAIGFAHGLPSAWQMLVTFGLGQFGLAIVLYLNLERIDD